MRALATLVALDGFFEATIGFFATIVGFFATIVAGFATGFAATIGFFAATGAGFFAATFVAGFAAGFTGATAATTTNGIGKGVCVNGATRARDGRRTTIARGRRSSGGARAFARSLSWSIEYVIYVRECWIYRSDARRLVTDRPSLGRVWYMDSECLSVCRVCPRM